MKTALVRYPGIFLRLVRGRPTLASFNVTNRCNERCPMCNVWRSDAAELSTAEIGTIFADLRRAGVGLVEISGGEPLLRSDLPEIIEILDRLGFLFTMTTNGTLWRGDVVDALCRSRGAVQLAVSLDSLRPEVYRLLRGRDCLPAVLDVIDRLGKARLGIPLKINLTLSRHNVDEAFDILEHARRRGLYLSVFPANGGPGRMHSSDDPLMAASGDDRQRMAEVFRRLARLRRRGEPLWEFSGFYDLAAEFITGNPPLECGAGRLFLDLHADGRLAPCVERRPVADLRLVNVDEALERVAAQADAVAACARNTPCCYTCTANVSLTARHPVRFALETLRVRLKRFARFHSGEDLRGD